MRARARRPALLALLLAARGAAAAGRAGEGLPPSPGEIRGADSGDDAHELILRDLADDAEEDHAGGVSEVYTASCMGDLSKVKKLLADGADVDGTGPFQVDMDRDPVPDATGLMCTALGQGENLENNKIAKLLIAKGANLEAEDGDGQTPLMYATAFGAVELAKELLNHNANVNARDLEGMTALMLAASNEYYDDSEMVQILVDNGADADLQDTKEGNTALMWAAQFGNRESGVVLVNYTKDLDAQDRRGDTALMVVVGLHTTWEDSYYLAEALLEGGANPMALNEEFVSPAEKMLTLRDENLTELFRAHYAPPRDLAEAIFIAFGPAVWVKSLTWLAIAVLSGLVLAAIVFAVQRKASGGGGGEEGAEFSEGAYDMGAMALRERGRQPVFLKLVRMVEVVASVAFPFGPLLHIVRWEVVAVLWGVLFALPALFVYGREVLANPVLMIAPLRLNERKKLGKPISALRVGFLLLIFVLAAMTLDWEWYHQESVKVSFTFENLRAEELSSEAKEDVIDTIKDKCHSAAGVDKDKVHVELASKNFLTVTAAIFTDAPHKVKKSMQQNSVKFAHNISDALKGLDSVKGLSTGGFQIPGRAVEICTDHPVWPHGHDFFWKDPLLGKFVTTNYSIIRTDFFWGTAPMISVSVLRLDVPPNVDCYKLFIISEMCIVLCAFLAIFLPWQCLFSEDKDYTKDQVKALRDILSSADEFDQHSDVEVEQNRKEWHVKVHRLYPKVEDVPERMQGDPIKVRKVTMRPDPRNFDLGAAVLMVSMLADMFYCDLSVIITLLAAGRPELASISAAIFFNSIFMEFLDWRGLPCISFHNEVKKTLQKGIYTKNLRSLIRRERGWEGFFQLPLTSFAVPLLSRSSPFLLMNGMFSMGLSAWGLASHLYLIVDCTMDIPEGKESTEEKEPLNTGPA